MKKLWVLIFSVLVLFSGCKSAPTTYQISEDLTSVSDTSIMTESTTIFLENVIEDDPVTFNAMSIVSDMTDEELIGQLFLVRCPGGQQALDDVARYHLGGYILFGNDFKNETPQSVIDHISSYQQAADYPLLIAVDEEGGTVTRVSRYSQFRSQNFPSPRKIYEHGGLDAVIETETEKCQLLKSLGINVNLGPVCDITLDPSSFMYDRSLGQDSLVTSNFVSSVVRVMTDNQVGSVLKHFPGYGNNVDTHVGIAVDNRSLDALVANDLVPFRAGIDSGCDAIMVSHTYINAIDTEMPASLSKDVISFLRTDMGFNGVIMTDDLAMDAISDLFGPEESVLLAIEAGVDVICCTDYPKHYEAVLVALRDGRITREQLEASAARIVSWKHKLGIL